MRLASEKSKRKRKRNVWKLSKKDQIGDVYHEESTTAKQKNIIHLVLPMWKGVLSCSNRGIWKWGVNLRINFCQSVKRAINWRLDYALGLGVESIVLGDIAMGMCGFPQKVYMDSLAKAIKQFAEYQSNDVILEFSVVHRDIEFVISILTKCKQFFEVLNSSLF